MSLPRPRRRAAAANRRRPATRRDRAQASLLAVAVALVILTVVTGLALAMADGALSGAQRDADERRVASSLATRLVAADSPVTTRANVLDADRLDALTGSGLERQFPVAEGERVRVRVGDSTVATTGAVGDGTTVRRLVLVERREAQTLEPDLEPGRSVTLPRRTGNATLRIDPPANTSVRTVRANDRVVLHAPDGLRGAFEVDLSRLETTTLRFVASGPVPEGSVEVRYAPVATTKTTLAVTVDG